MLILCSKYSPHFLFSIRCWLLFKAVEMIRFRDKLEQFSSEYDKIKASQNKIITALMKVLEDKDEVTRSSTQV